MAKSLLEAYQEKRAAMREQGELPQTEPAPVATDTTVAPPPEPVIPDPEAPTAMEEAAAKEPPERKPVTLMDLYQQQYGTPNPPTSIPTTTEPQQEPPGFFSALGTAAKEVARGYPEKDPLSALEEALTGGKPIPLERAGIFEGYEEGTGAVVHIPESRKQAQKQFTRLEEHPHAETERYDAAMRFIRASKQALGARAHEDVLTPQPSESIFHWLEPFDWARRYSWLALEKLGEFAPDPTEEGKAPTFSSRAGDYLQTFSGKLVGNYLEWTTGYLPQFAFLTPAETIYDILMGEEKGVVDEVGENLYAAMSSGELFQQGWERKGLEYGFPGIDMRVVRDPETGEIVQRNIDLPLGDVPPGEEVEGWRSSNPMGIDIIDAAIPPELALRLAAKAETPMARWFYGNMTTHLGREAMGLFLEFVLDPLWALGPAKGAQVVNKGNKAYSVAAPLMRAANRAAAVLPGEKASTASKHIVDLVVGSADEVEEATKFFDKAMVEAEAQFARKNADAKRWAEMARHPESAVDEANELAQKAIKETDDMISHYQEIPDARARLAVMESHKARLVEEARQISNAGNAANYLRRMASQTAKDANSYRSDLEAIRRGMALVHKAKDGGQIFKEAGTVAFHLPLFGQKTYYVSKLPGVKVLERTADFMPSPLVRAYDSTIDAAGKVVTKGQDMLKPYGKEHLSYLAAKAEDLPVTTHMNPGQRLAYVGHEVTGQFSNLSRLAFSGMARFMGTRFVQPMMSKLMTDAQMAMKGKPGMFYEFTIGGNTYQRLRRADPETWNRYHEAVTNFFNRMRSQEQQVLIKMKTIYESSKAVHKVRKKKAAEQLKVAEAKLAEHMRRRSGTMQPGQLGLHDDKANQLRNYIEDVKRWSRDDYSVQDVIDEAWDLHERGAGRLYHKDLGGAGIQQAVEKIDDARRFFFDTFEGDISEINQALYAMGAKAKGDPARAKEIQAAMEHIDHMLRKGGGVDKWREERIMQLELAAEHRIQEIDGLQAMVTEISPDKLAEVLEKIQLGIAHQPMSRSRGQELAIRDLVVAILNGDKAAANSVFVNAAVAMGESSGEMALRVLSDMVALQGKAGPGRSLVKAINELLGEWNKQSTALRHLASGRFNPHKEAEVLGSILNSQLEKSISYLRAHIGRADWDNFLAWVRASELERAAEVPETWLAGERQWKRMMNLAEVAADAHAGRASLVRNTMRTAGIEGRKLGPFTKENLLLERFRRAIDGVTDEAEARGRIRSALDDLLDIADDPVMTKMADAMAARMTERLMKGKLPLEEAAQARTMAKAAITRHKQQLTREARAALKAEKKAVRVEAKAKRAELKREYVELEKELVRVEPRFILPPREKGKRPSVRKMQRWEADLYQEYKRITDGLDDYDKMRVSMAALRWGPNPQWMKDKYGEMMKAYGSQYGRRFDDIPAEMDPIVHQVRSVVKSFEELYEEFGFDFMKDPYARMADWGVVEYAPHVAEEVTLAAKGKDILRRYVEGGELPDAISDLDKRLSLNMEASKLRTIRGTVREIHERVNDSADRFTFDPNVIAARYIHSIRAISAKEFLVGLVHGKVARMMSLEEAQQLDYVPLFERTKPTAAQPFARWIDTIPDLAQERLVKDALERLPEGVSRDFAARAAPEIDRFAFNQQMVHPTKKEFQQIVELGYTGKRSDPVHATQLRDWLGMETWKGAVGVEGETFVRNLWRGYATELNQVAQPKSRVKGEWLEKFFSSDEKIEQLYIPRVVYQSMVDVMTLEKSPIMKAWPTRAIQQFQNFWKARLTVTSVAFTTRNAVSNTLSNMLDLGVHGALSPETNLRASQLAVAHQFADSFGGGSLRQAYKVLKEGTSPDPTIAARLKGWLGTKTFEGAGIFKEYGLNRLIDEGVDLGDGRIRDIDDALNMLRQRGVLSESYTQFVDINHWEAGLAEAMATRKWDVLRKVAQRGEDVFFLLWPQLMAGGLWVPTALPVKWGEVLARHVENQGRLVNFIGNMRRSGSFDLAAQHVNKFLFDYGDLTTAQKTWMRFLIPFFTWTQKNVLLHMDMIFKSPIYYGQFNRLLLDTGPRMAEVMKTEDVGLGIPALTSQDAADTKGIIHREMGSDLEILGRQDYTLSKVRMALPEFMGAGENMYLEGTGAPIESCVEQLAIITSGLNLERSISEASAYGDNTTALRIMGQSNFLIRFFLEQATARNYYYNKRFDKLTNANLIAENIAAAQRVPLVGGTLAQYMNWLTGYHVGMKYNREGDTFEKVRSAYPRMNHLVSNLMYSRMVRETAAISDLYHLQLGANIMLGASLSDWGEPKQSRVPLFWRVGDAYFGMRVVQDNPELGRRIRRYNIAKQERAEFESRGAYLR